jgi:hypothetical protein
VGQPPYRQYSRKTFAAPPALSALAFTHPLLRPGRHIARNPFFSSPALASDATSQFVPDAKLALGVRELSLLMYLSLLRGRAVHSFAFPSCRVFSIRSVLRDNASSLGITKNHYRSVFHLIVPFYDCSFLWMRTREFRPRKSLSGPSTPRSLAERGMSFK